MSKTPTCLEGAGMLGHTWVATLQSNGDVRIYTQASYGSDAVRALDEYKGTETPGEIYERTGMWRGRAVWKRRSRALSLLDQNPQFPYEPAMAEPQP